MSRNFTLVSVALILFCLGNTLQAQQKSLKGNGEVFFYEDFDWADPSDPRGWSLPDGYKLIDHDDQGTNWVWMAQDSMIAQYTADPPFRSTSASNGYFGTSIELV